MTNSTSELSAGLHRDAGPPKLLEATLVGLQAVRSKYGADSKQAAAAATLLRGTLEEVWAALHESTGGQPSFCRSHTAPLRVRMLAELQGAVSRMQVDVAFAPSVRWWRQSSLPGVWGRQRHRLVDYLAGGRVVAQLASVDVRPDAKLQDMQQWLVQHRAPFQRRLLQQGACAFQQHTWKLCASLSGCIWVLGNAMAQTSMQPTWITHCQPASRWDRGACRWGVPHDRLWRHVRQLGHIVCRLAHLHHPAGLHHRLGRLLVQCEASARICGRAVMGAA